MLCRNLHARAAFSYSSSSCGCRCGRDPEPCLICRGTVSYQGLSGNRLFSFFFFFPESSLKFSPVSAGLCRNLAAYPCCTSKNTSCREAKTDLMKSKGDGDDDQSEKRWTGEEKPRRDNEHRRYSNTPPPHPVASLRPTVTDAPDLTRYLCAARGV